MQRHMREAETLAKRDLTSSHSMLNFKYDYKSEQKCLKNYKKMQKKELKASFPAFSLSPRLEQPGMQNAASTNASTQCSMANVASAFNIDPLAANGTKGFDVKLTANANQPVLPIYTAGLLEPTRELQKDKPCSSVAAVNRQDSTHDMFSSSLDPFNDMELKTINDLEELKTILQNHQIVEDFQQQQGQQPTQDSMNSMHPVLSLTQGKQELPHATSQDNFGLPKISFVNNDVNSK